MTPASPTSPQSAADRELQQRVLAALESYPFDTAAIGVRVVHGVATLQGLVRTLEEKWLVERVVGGMPSIRAVANELVVNADLKPSVDSLLAEAAANALTWQRVVEPNAVKVIVEDGWVTLTGVVDDLHQRGAAERAVRALNGVRGVSNAIAVTQGPAVTPSPDTE